MKKIIIEGIREQAEYYCDKHPDRQCYSELKTDSWFGSKFDLMSIELHLCDECLEKLYNDLFTKFNKKPKEHDLVY